MHHVAIMNKKQASIPEIYSELKTIESRWLLRRSIPWRKVKKGDTLFFKYTGQPVTLKAKAARVKEFELKKSSDSLKILSKFGKKIRMTRADLKNKGTKPRFCVLVFLKKPKLVRPFNINKTGFGLGAAWITLKNIETIRI